MAGKHYQDADVHAATLSRLRLVFRNFERVCVAFSGGKDSSVTLQLALDVARELGRSPVDVLFIDLEGQYQAQCHQPKLQPCPRQAPRSSQPPWPSGDDQASAAQSGGLAGLAVM
ncbi:hypothetical protein IPC1320_24785 [Pseudomonas aeruginosa]|nr:hypothetical protein IPC1320_24785 [Pseudomonas aeruginosa]